MFFVVLDTRCDQLHRVAASRLFFVENEISISSTKVQKKLQTTKYFLNFFCKNSHKKITHHYCPITVGYWRLPKGYLPFPDFT